MQIKVFGYLRLCKCASLRVILQFTLKCTRRHSCSIQTKTYANVHEKLFCSKQGRLLGISSSAAEKEKGFIERKSHPYVLDLVAFTLQWQSREGKK